MRSEVDYKEQPAVRGNSRMMRAILITLLLLSPLLFDFLWVVASWWRPILGFGPEPGFKTPFLDVFNVFTEKSSNSAGNLWAEIYGMVFASPARGIAIFLSIAGAMMLLMRRGESR